MKEAHGLVALFRPRGPDPDVTKRSGPVLHRAVYIYTFHFPFEMPDVSPRFLFLCKQGERVEVCLNISSPLNSSPDSNFLPEHLRVLEDFCEAKLYNFFFVSPTRALTLHGDSDGCADLRLYNFSAFLRPSLRFPHLFLF